MARIKRIHAKCAATLVGFVAALSPARADDAARVTYRAAPGCPDAAAFLERVRERTPHAVLGQDGANAAFVVTVRSAEGASSGRVDFADSTGERVVRHVAGSTCDEVVSAAALITALAVEAKLTTSDPPPHGHVEKAAPLPDVAREAEPPRGSPTWSVGATAGVDSWSLPSSAYSAAVFGELGSAAPFRYVRLGIRGATGATSIDERNASFRLLAGRLSLCPFAIDLAPQFELTPCAGIDIGPLHGEGQASAALPNTRSATIFWGAAHAALRLRWRMARAFTFELGGELGFPLVRHDFVFELPHQMVGQVPVVGAGIALGAVVHFR
jgi:hypothetical protein